jgi:hypothetical protein
MTVPKRNFDAEEPAARAHRRRVEFHCVSGRVIDCCETGETDCPCICHNDTDGDEQP